MAVIQNNTTAECGISVFASLTEGSETVDYLYITPPPHEFGAKPHTSVTPICISIAEIFPATIRVAATPATFPTIKNALPQRRQSSRQQNMRCRNAGNPPDDKIFTAATPANLLTTKNVLPQRRQPSRRQNIHCRDTGNPPDNRKCIAATPATYYIMLN
jgi:hypothetical protein